MKQYLIIWRKFNYDRGEYLHINVVIAASEQEAVDKTIPKPNPEYDGLLTGREYVIQEIVPGQDLHLIDDDLTPLYKPIDVY